MKNNIVLLKTYLSRATGIMYPCNYDMAGNNQPYIIFTCAHLFDEMEKLPKDGDDIKEYININIFDDDGNVIDKSEIAEIKYHIPKLENEKFCDVAVLLVLIRPYKRISLKTKVFNGELENRTTVFVEGYPAVMLDDEINQKIQLMGLSKQMFPDKKELGMYQIEDEYHWYNNFLDKKLLEGFSGSPVYIKENDDISILGMNESVVNIENGKNPFKIVYYLKFRYILDLLRKSRCIFFIPEADGSIKIDWILDLEGVLMKDDKKDLTMLMFGDSGAGKSSFAHTFAYHSKYLKITGGGQTTRTNIAYKFNLLSGKNAAKVRFMSEDEFVEMMKNKNRVKSWNVFFRKIAKIESISINDNGNTFLSYVYKFLSGRKDYRKDILGYLLGNDRNEENTNDITSIYDKIIKSIINIIEMDQIPFVFDKEKIEEWYYNYRTQINGRRSSEDGEEIFKKILADTEKIIDKKIYNSLFKHFNSNTKEFNWDSYYKDINDSFNKDNVVDEENKNVKLIKDKLYSDEFLSEYAKSLLSIEGFFALSEFNISGIEEILSNVREKLEKDKKEKQENRQIQLLDLEKFDVQVKLDEISETIYISAYKCIMNSIYNDLKNVSLKECDKDIVTFELDKMTQHETILLTRCLRVIDNKSYTGMIQSVEIEDEISDIYAMTLKKMRIRSITLLDTCGLNHVENDETSLVKVRNIITRYRDAGVKFEDVAVLYVKKLDAGRPDELRNIIPIIVRALPKAPMYCVFTGTDIFYGRNVCRMQNIQWEKEKEEKLPKPVKFIINQDYEEILKSVEMRPARKRHFGLILKNNLIAFCGDKEFSEKNFDVFSSNLLNVSKLLASISLNEYTSLMLVNPDKIKKKLDDPKCRTEIEKLLRAIFERASVKSWNSLHHNISKANYVRIHNSDRNDMGFEGACRHRWSQLFHDAYDDVVAGKSSDFLDLFDENEVMAVEGALLKMSDKYFLGEDKMLFKKNFANGEEKNDFRRLLEEMYEGDIEGEKIYKYNPFKKNDKNVEFVNLSKEDAVKYLEDVVDFEKGLKNEAILKKFSDCFCNALINQIREDNKTKPVALVNINDDLKKAIDELEINFKNKFGNEYDVYDILIQYLQDKRSTEE